MSKDVLGAQDNLGIVVDFVTKLKNGTISPTEAKRFLRRERPFEAVPAGVVQDFDPALFIGEGWRIAEDCEQLPEHWDPSKTVLVSALKQNESRITGDETRKRLADKPLLGAKAFWHYWNNQEHIPVDWKGKYVFFDATVLQRPDGDWCSLYLCWDGDRWYWDCRWLDNDRYSGDHSAAHAR